MADGIRRFNFFCSPDDRYVHPAGEWVRFSDVQARLGEKSGEIDRLSEELDQANARIRDLETQLVDTDRRRAAAVDRGDRLADAVQSGLTDLRYAAPEIFAEKAVRAARRFDAALRVYRGPGEAGK